MKVIKNSKGIFSVFSLLWENKERIMEVISIVQKVAKHAKNLIEDLQDDGKLNGSNQVEK